ncbi:MAG: hypothetical protein PVF83_03825 [Anaerolineales bacterium]
MGWELRRCRGCATGVYVRAFGGRWENGGMEVGDRKRNDGLILEGREVFAHSLRLGIGWGEEKWLVFQAFPPHLLTRRSASSPPKGEGFVV